MTQLQKICSLLNILTFRRSNMTEEQLKARVAKALFQNARNGSEFNRLGNPSLCALTEAEDQLAQWRFKRDVDNEMKRMESVVDDELKRIEGLNREISPHEECYGCKVNLSNTLAIAKKIGHENLEGSFEGFHESLNYVTFCCGKRFCHICRHEHEYQLNDENKLVKCPICFGRIAPGKLPAFKALEKLAHQKIPWALTKLYRVYATGLYGKKIDRQKAKSLLLEAASAGDPIALLELGNSKIDREKAKSFLLEVASTEDPIALFALGNSLDQGSHEARKYYLLAADKGYLPAYAELASMHLFGYDPKESFRHASIYTFFTPLNGCGVLGRLHHLSFFGMNSKYSQLKKSESLNLACYWTGKFVSTRKDDRDLRLCFTTLLLPDIFKIWYPFSAPSTRLSCPGYSILPLAKRIRGEGNAFDCEVGRALDDELPFAELKEFCYGCGESDRKAFLACSGCKVFHYCGKDCQLKHWRAGHKRECSKKHWLERFCPDIRK